MLEISHVTLIEILMHEINVLMLMREVKNNDKIYRREIRTIWGLKLK